MTGGADLYLELMKKCLTNTIYAEFEYRNVNAGNPVKRILTRALASQGISLIRKGTFSTELREGGLDWPPYAHTMIGLKRLNNIQYCMEDVLNSQVPGDLIETGVWRGGSTIFMRAVLRAYGVKDRKVWVADSFEGLPAPDESKYPADKGDDLHEFEELAVSLEKVQENFAKYDLLDDQVKFLKGWFSDTLPEAPIEQLAIMRLDGDMYESTIDALRSLYPKLSVGGYVIIDDWGAVEGCRAATNDFRRDNNISDPIVAIDGMGVYWKRSN